jgi:hypothetical protein
VAIANHTAASAAYWIASQADEVVVTPSGQVGSIGVVGPTRTSARPRPSSGIKTTLISAGKYKTEGNALRALSRATPWPPGRPWPTPTTADVRRRRREGRGVKAATTSGADFGQGRMVLAKDAVAAGMADRVDTYENTVRRLGAGQVNGRRSEHPAEPPDDTEASAAADVDPSPTPPAVTAGSTPPARVRVRHDLELLEASLRGGYGWISPAEESTRV